MTKVNIETEQEVAKSHGWNRLGSFPIEVRVPISAEERIELGIVQSKAIHKINELKSQKKVFNAEIKSQIEEQQEIMEHAADTTRIGTRAVEKVLPCFYDPQGNCRVFMDLETGEVVERKPAASEDNQMRIA